MQSSENRCVVRTAGRLDTNTAPDLEQALQKVTASEVVLDCSALEYVSSAGLRVILATHKRMAGEGKTLTLQGVRPEVRSLLDMTGFSRILHLAE